MKLPRLRARFSLRTLLAVITILAALLGWQTHVVRERQALRKSISERGGSILSERFFPGGDQLPWYRRLLGDEGVCFIFLPQGSSDAEKDQIKATFSECEHIAVWENFPTVWQSQCGDWTQH